MQFGTFVSMKRLLAAFLLAFTPACFAADAAPSKPNILILLADDLGYADLGVQGVKDVPTPHIDSIAKNGVRFTNGYISAPACSPSRAGLLTGRYQTRFGHEFNHPLADRAPVGLPVEERTAADWFKAAGYNTAHIGKWHLGNPNLPKFNVIARGFDLSVLMPGQNKLPPLIVFRNGTRERPDDAYVDQAMGREADTYIRQHKSEPWFLYVGFLTPHVPLQVPPGAEEPFVAIKDEKRRKNAAMIALLDESVGRILKALRDTGQEERTLIVFVSDNGAPLGSGSNNTPLRGFKSTLREGGIRVPFLMQWKGTLPAGRVEHEPIIALDLLPTALAAAKADVPKDAKLDGVNLLPYLTGQTKEAPRRSLFWRYGEQFAVRQGEWKLVHAMDHVSKPPVYKTGLYDVARDPAEERDLSAEHPEKVKALRGAWEVWDKSNVAPLWTSETKVEPVPVEKKR